MIYHVLSRPIYLGSGQAAKVLEEAGVHAEGQIKAVLNYAAAMEKKPRSPHKSLRKKGK